MVTFRKSGRFRLPVSFVVIVGILSSAIAASGQSDLRNSGVNPNPTGLQGAQEQPFQLPGLPPLPSQNPVAGAQNPDFFQSRIVNEKYAGWRQASDGRDGERLDDIIRSQWVMADDTGRLSGIVYGIEGADLGDLNITLLNNGRVVTTTFPNDDGTFVFPNVRQGTYAIVGWGDNAFFAFSFNILDFNEAIDENMPSELRVTAVPNKTTINTDWIQYFSTGVKFPIYGRHETGQGENDPPDLFGFVAQAQFIPAARPATSISSHQIIPTSDGRLLGRVHQMTSLSGRPVELRNTRIMLLQNDDVVAAVTTDNYGIFEFPEVTAGEYSCVAVGQDGLGCIGIYVGDKGGSNTGDEADESGNDSDDTMVDEDLFAPISFTMLTSETVGWLNNLAIETAYQRIVSRPIPNTQPVEPNAEFGPGCPGPGSLRPGGYRPQPRSAIPQDQRPLPRFNRSIDRLFNGDDSGSGFTNGSANFQQPSNFGGQGF